MNEQQRPEARDRIRTFIGTQVQAIFKQTRHSATLVTRGQERRAERRRQQLIRRSTQRQTTDRRQTITDRRRQVTPGF